ncbi:hypothetical protein [Desulfitobacterium sp.]|uniref:hypothetical protein n=1 Tax=Desulfitobacterium sp. TaxID=49981 RepID=UPI002B1FBB37|nr:hypothetical protein [Desulfitobacterium sp.]MEA4901136.1 hypothetical protein [Desulfitobacterium sp.]
MKIHNIRNTVIVVAIFGLLAASLYGNSYTVDNKVSKNDLRQSSNLLNQANLSSADSYSDYTTQLSLSPSTPTLSSTAASTNETLTADSSLPSQPNPAVSAAGSEDRSILAQVQNSVHNKVFPKTEGLACQVCHKMINDSYPLQKKSWESCGSCHVNPNGNPVLGNEILHPQFQMIQGVAVGDLLPMPSYKYKYMKDTFACTDCHLTNSTKHDFLVPGVTIKHDSDGIHRIETEIDYQDFKTIFNQDKCAVCHPSSADMVERVKKEQLTISQKLAELKPIYEKWGAKTASMNPEDPNVIAFKNGATYYTFVDSDGSKGAHNFPYALVLLEKAENYWKMLKQ